MLATTAAPSALASVSALPESAVPRHPVATVETSAGDRVLYALQPKQWKCFNLTPLAREVDEPYPENIGYGGAAGGGKSYLSRAVVVAAALLWPGSKSIIFRRTEGEVKENHVNNFRTEVPDVIDGVRLYDWNGDDFCATWYNGSRTYFGYLKVDSDVFRYTGNDYDIIVFEEATHYSWFQVSWLLGNRLRATIDGTRPFALFPSNPGSKGHFWYKRLFIDRNFSSESDEHPDQYAFVQALLADNQVLRQRDPRYERRLNRLPEPWRSWQRDGDFHAGAGAMLSELNRDIHLIEPFEVPPHWLRFGSFDWGYAHPWVFGEYAVNEDGRIFKLQTLSKIRQLPDAIARTIREHVVIERLSYITAGWDAWAKKASMGENTPSIAEVFEEYGIYLTRANIDRVQGLQTLKRALQFKDKEGEGIDGVPDLVFFRNQGNIAAIAQLESMTPDPDDMNDVLKVDADEYGRGGDDIYDETRYAAASRPQSADEEFGAPAIDAWAPETLQYEAEMTHRHWDPLIDPDRFETLEDGQFGEMY